MAVTAADQAAAVTQVASAVKELDRKQLDVVETLLRPDQKTTNIVWIIAIGSLALLLLLALGGLVYKLIDDGSSAAITTAFTALLTGFIGLLAPSPTKRGS